MIIIINRFWNILIYCNFITMTAWSALQSIDEGSRAQESRDKEGDTE